MSQVVNYNYVRFEELDRDLWSKIVRLYHNNPVDHCYLLNGLIYSPENSDAIFVLKGGEIIGYIYANRGRRGLRIVSWGETSPELLSTIISESSFLIMNFQKDVSEVVLEPYQKILYDKGYHKQEIGLFYDMITDEDSFKPVETSGVRRLAEKDLDAFIEIRKIQERPISREEALELIKRKLFYGVFDNDTLVGIAGARIKLPEVWIIGNVFVHPDYRGRGYGKAVTSAISRDAVKSGAIAYLQVETDNKVAISIYEKLGYRAIRKNPWIFAEK